MVLVGLMGFAKILPTNVLRKLIGPLKVRWPDLRQGKASPCLMLRGQCSGFEPLEAPSSIHVASSY